MRGHPLGPVGQTSLIQRSGQIPKRHRGVDLEAVIQAGQFLHHWRAIREAGCTETSARIPL
jgi:hypothetical protein